MRRTFRSWMVRIICCSFVVGLGVVTWNVRHDVSHAEPVETVSIAQDLDVPTSDITCLAQALYFEAATESLKGMQAVASVVFNRAASPGYPETLCEVVYQRGQFSWTTNPQKRRRSPSVRYMQLAVDMIKNRGILQEQYPVTHFHHVSVSPRWSRRLAYFTTIGSHRFYGQP